jgi:thioesterase domain-containing protein
VTGSQGAPAEPYLDWANIILSFARVGAEIPEEDLRRFERVEDQVAHAIERGPPGLTMEDAMYYVRASTMNNRAKNKYIPCSYPGTVTLFRAALGHVLRCSDSSLGWQAVARGGLEIAQVPGEHGVMVEIPHVTELARKVREALDRAICGIQTAEGTSS